MNTLKKLRNKLKHRRYDGQLDQCRDLCDQAISETYEDRPLAYLSAGFIFAGLVFLGLFSLGAIKIL